MNDIDDIAYNPKADGLESKCPLCNSKGFFSFQGRDFLFDKPETYQYMQCSHCAAVYQSPMPATSEIGNFYPDDYSVYKEIPNLKHHSRTKLGVLRYKYNYTHLDVPWLYRLISRVVSFLRYRDAIRFIPHGRGLDIGCGNGKFIRDMNSLGWQFEGVEFNSIAVDICNKAGLKVFHGDLHAAAFKDNNFDIISARHVIEHIPDPMNFMREIARILKKGGRLVIKTPNSIALGRQWFGMHWFDNDVPRHLILFSPVNLKMIAERFGLSQITVKTFTGPRVILNSLDYLKGNMGKPYYKYKLYRLLARLYVLSTIISRRGDELFAIYEKT